MYHPNCSNYGTNVHLMMASEDPFSATGEHSVGYVYRNSPSMDNVDDEAMQVAYPFAQEYQPPSKHAQMRLPGTRRRLNAYAIFLAFIIPYGVFFLTFICLCSKLHYRFPFGAASIVLSVTIFTVLFGLSALGKLQRKYFQFQLSEPSWLVFIAICNVLALCVAIGSGEFVFEDHFRSHWDLDNLNNFTGVNPSFIRGEMVMDAGFMDFVPGTKLDLSKSMGFRNNDVYCVAPIAFGSNMMDHYDFWAVGMNCCSEMMGPATFHCSNFHNNRANGALRLVGGQSDEERPFYRLAVQQAEAAYNISAVHPLFFHWVVDPTVEHEKYWLEGEKRLHEALAIYFLIQFFMVVCAVLAFGKLGFTD